MKVSLSQNNRAFTLIEVLMVLGLLTLIIGLIVRMQVHSFDRLEQDRDALQKIYLVRRAMLDALKNPKIDKLHLVKKEYEDGAIKVKTALHDTAKKSRLKNISKDVRMLTTAATWQLRAKNKQHAQLVYFLYLPEEKKKS